jgi:hypothetical protein
VPIIFIGLSGSDLRVSFVELLGDSEDDAAQSTESGIFGKIKRSCDKIDHLEAEQAEDLFLWIGAFPALDAAMREFAEDILVRH